MSFNPRTPCGVRPERGIPLYFFERVSIHALLAECDREGKLHMTIYNVSIHALLAECDIQRVIDSKATNVSIHALLAECD